MTEQQEKRIVLIYAGSLLLWTVLACVGAVLALPYAFGAVPVDEHSRKIETTRARAEKSGLPLVVFWKIPVVESDEWVSCGVNVAPEPADYPISVEIPNAAGKLEILGKARDEKGLRYLLSGDK